LEDGSLILAHNPNIVSVNARVWEERLEIVSDFNAEFWPTLMN